VRAARESTGHVSPLVESRPQPVSEGTPVQQHSIESAYHALLARAVAMQWVSARDDGMIVPGTVNPIPVMPVVERSRSDRVTSWGPGPGALW
jgi:hypothetical protein